MTTTAAALLWKRIKADYNVQEMTIWPSRYAEIVNCITAALRRVREETIEFVADELLAMCECSDSDAETSTLISTSKIIREMARAPNAPKEGEK